MTPIPGQSWRVGKELVVRWRQADLKCHRVESFDLLHVFQLGMEGTWLPFQIYGKGSLPKVGVVSVVSLKGEEYGILCHHDASLFPDL